MKPHYIWPEMLCFVDLYVRNCKHCQQTKSATHAPFGLLRPLAVPDRLWQHIIWDFVTGLSSSDGFDCILIVVDRVTKMRHLIPCSSNITAAQLADLFVEKVWRLHGLLNTIVSYCGTLFASDFWNSLCRTLGNEPQLSTAFYPQTDAQSQRLNAGFKTYICGYINYFQNDWEKLLPLAEFAGNNHRSETTGTSRFFTNVRQDPRTFFDLQENTLGK